MSDRKGKKPMKHVQCSQGHNHEPWPIRENIFFYHCERLCQLCGKKWNTIWELKEHVEEHSKVLKLLGAAAYYDGIWPRFQSLLKPEKWAWDYFFASVQAATQEQAARAQAQTRMRDEMGLPQNQHHTHQVQYPQQLQNHNVQNHAGHINVGAGRADMANPLLPGQQNHERLFLEQVERMRARAGYAGAMPHHTAQPHNHNHAGEWDPLNQLQNQNNHNQYAGPAYPPPFQAQPWNPQYQAQNYNNHNNHAGPAYPPPFQAQPWNPQYQPHNHDHAGGGNVNMGYLPPQAQPWNPHYQPQNHNDYNNHAGPAYPPPFQAQPWNPQHQAQNHNHYNNYAGPAYFPPVQAQPQSHQQQFFQQFDYNHAAMAYPSPPAFPQSSERSTQRSGYNHDHAESSNTDTVHLPQAKRQKHDRQSQAVERDNFDKEKEDEVAEILMQMLEACPRKMMDSENNNAAGPSKTSSALAPAPNQQENVDEDVGTMDAKGKDGESVPVEPESAEPESMHVDEDQDQDQQEEEGYHISVEMMDMLDEAEERWEAAGREEGGEEEKPENIDLRSYWPRSDLLESPPHSDSDEESPPPSPLRIEEIDSEDSEDLEDLEDFEDPRPKSSLRPRLEIYFITEVSVRQYPSFHQYPCGFVLGVYTTRASAEQATRQLKRSKTVMGILGNHLEDDLLCWQGQIIDTTRSQFDELSNIPAKIDLQRGRIDMNGKVLEKGDVVYSVSMCYITELHGGDEACGGCLDPEIEIIGVTMDKSAAEKVLDKIEKYYRYEQDEWLHKFLISSIRPSDGMRWLAVPEVPVRLSPEPMEYVFYHITRHVVEEDIVEEETKDVKGKGKGKGKGKANRKRKRDEKELIWLEEWKRSRIAIIFPDDDDTKE